MQMSFFFNGGGILAMTAMPLARSCRLHKKLQAIAMMSIIVENNEWIETVGCCCVLFCARQHQTLIWSLARESSRNFPNSGPRI
jgi:hypothetical protein